MMSDLDLLSSFLLYSTQDGVTKWLAGGPFAGLKPVDFSQLSSLYLEGVTCPVRLQQRAHSMLHVQHVQSLM